MNNEQYIMKLQAVINTLNGAMLRADQIDAIQRIDVCTKELKHIIEALNAPKEEQGA